MLASNTVLGNWQRQLGAATAVIVTAVDPSLLVESRASPPGWTRLCHTQAAGAGPRMIQALKSGILGLIFPPIGICIGLMVMSYKKRNQFDEQSNSERKAERKADRRSDLGW